MIWTAMSEYREDVLESYAPVLASVTLKKGKTMNWICNGLPETMA
jgi:hypothetical protein